MKEWDVVSLNKSDYLQPEDPDHLVQNIMTEDALLKKALEELGLRVVRKAWDDPDFDWSSTKTAVFRATWDYFTRIDEFRGWLQSVRKQCQLINSAELIEWNLDKHYLLELKEKGIRIPNTVLLKKGNKQSLEEHYEQLQKLGASDHRCVLKPCISGGAYHTYLIDPEELASYEETYQELIASHDFLLQEFQIQVPLEGERSYMVFGGNYSHAVLKKAKSGDFRVQDDFGGSLHECSPTKEEQQIAMNVVKACPFEAVYARVDLFKDNTGHWALAEIELIEPELWFRKDENAAPLLAKAVKHYLDEKEA